MRSFVNPRSSRWQSHRCRRDFPTPSLSRWTTANDLRHYPSLASSADNGPNASLT